MDVDKPVLEGYLFVYNVPTQSGFSLTRISKKKPCQRYCLLFSASRHGIERLEICENKEDKNAKIITLENCVKITQDPPPANLIQIVKKTGTLTLNTLTEDDLKGWVNALQTVAFRDKTVTAHHGAHAAIEEDNDLYCSSYGDGLFVVKLVPTDTSIRCNIEPITYMLHLTTTELQLKRIDDLNKIIAKWPYRFIRKYGYRDGKFTFEAGRKCFTGEGVFTLDNTNPHDVFRCMSGKMKSMKKLINIDSLNNLERGENQLSAAASMEAGSRSPLPPSPSKQIASDFELNSNPSCLSLRGFLSSTDSLNNFSVNSGASTSNSNSSAALLLPSLSSKHVPNKPPRKLMSPIGFPTIQIHQNTSGVTSIDNKASAGQQNCDKFVKKFQTYEPVTITSSIDPNKSVGSTVILKSNSPEPCTAANKHLRPLQLTERDYESIEAITDAWKTLGLGDIKHCERMASNDNDLIDFAWQRAIQQQQEKSPQQHKESLQIKMTANDNNCSNNNSCNTTTAPDATYDRLDFLSPNNKSSSGYKTILAVKAESHRLRPNLQIASNDYELIASPDIQPCRKADDSHFGYGVLRKSNTAANCNNTNTDSSTITTTTITTTTKKQQNLQKSNHNNNNDIPTNTTTASAAGFQTTITTTTFPTGAASLPSTPSTPLQQPPPPITTNTNNNNNINNINNNNNNNLTTAITKTVIGGIGIGIGTVPPPLIPPPSRTTISKSGTRIPAPPSTTITSTTSSSSTITTMTELNKGNNNELVDRRIYNGLNYIVSKPKTV